MTAILTEEPPDLSVDEPEHPSRPRPDRPPLPREEPRGALPVGARPRVRPRDALGTSRSDGRSPRAGAVAGPRALPPCGIGAILLAAGVGAGFLARELSRKTVAAVLPAADLPPRHGLHGAVRSRRADRRLQRRLGGQPIEVCPDRPESPESRPLGSEEREPLRLVPRRRARRDARCQDHASGYERFGTLARVPLAGGSPRPVLENVRYADWTPDGRELMVERAVGDKHRIEFPHREGRSTSTTGGSTRRACRRAGTRSRSSRLCGAPASGPRSASWICGQRQDAGDDEATGGISPGRPTARRSVRGARAGNAGHDRVSPGGDALRENVGSCLRFPGILEFHDVSREGRVLLARVGLRPELIGLAPGESKERELTWLDGSVLADLSPDGKTLLISEEGEGGGSNRSIYLRKTDGSPAAPDRGGPRTESFSGRTMGPRDGSDDSPSARSPADWPRRPPASEVRRSLRRRRRNLLPRREAAASPGHPGRPAASAFRRLHRGRQAAAAYAEGIRRRRPSGIPSRRTEASSRCSMPTEKCSSARRKAGT